MNIQHSTAHRLGQWYTAAVKRLTAKGYRVSGGSWCFPFPRVGAAGACVFSVESHGPTTYGHPRASLHLVVSEVRS